MTNANFRGADLYCQNGAKSNNSMKGLNKNTIPNHSLITHGLTHPLYSNHSHSKNFSTILIHNLFFSFNVYIQENQINQTECK